MSGMGSVAGASADYVIAPGAFVDPRFTSGQPGTYVVTMTLQNVKTSTPKRPYLDAKPWNDALAAQGLNANVTAVKWTKSSVARDSNWAGTLLTDIFGGDVNENVVQDLTFEVTVQVFGNKTTALSAGSPSDSIPEGVDYSEPGMSGLGAVQLGAGAVFAIIAVVAIVLAVTFPGFGKMVLAGVTFVGEVLGAAIGGGAKAIASNAVPLLAVAAVAAVGIWMLKKGGAKYAKGSGFSF